MSIRKNPGMLYRLTLKSRTSAVNIRNLKPGYGRNQVDLNIGDDRNFVPTSGREVIAAGLTGLMQDRGISDSVEYVNELRRREFDE